MVVVGGFLLGAILFAQVAGPIHKVFDPLQVQRFVSVKQIFGVEIKAPDLRITTLEGEQFTIKELSGQNQLLVINFWGTWCRPCIEEIPYFEKVHRAYQNKGIAIVGVATKDSLSVVRKFIAQRGITYKIALDDQDKITTAFGGMRVLPTTIFIDNQNNVVKIHKGFLAQRELDRNIKNLLPGATNETDG